ncbi:hypothetical protein B0H11DRAFT_2276008 [Mycena galericulata]|nr:hypothetical protein B0H11DRAFT_2276008 [Mycena galericulata]
MARFYEGILMSHHESAEMVYVKARLAISYSLLGATGSAIKLAQEIQAQLADMDIQDGEFDSLLDGWDAMLQVEAVNAAVSDMSATTYQTWKATKYHLFPTHLSIPSGHEVLKLQALIANTIETNHIESTFLITMGSMQDLIRHGVAQGVVEVHHQSEIKEHSVIKSMLNNTLSAYDIVESSANPGCAT